MVTFQNSDRPPEEGSIDKPTRIVIPSIHVDAALEEVAMTTDGLMDVPKNSLNAGWYTSGPRPGEIGNAVIDGHVNGKYGTRAVFSDLHTIKPGNEILIRNHQGGLISFVVREIRTYDPGANTSAIFTSDDGKAHLNLITCEGVWDKTTKDYSKRLVIFADKTNKVESP